MPVNESMTARIAEEHRIEVLTEYDLFGTPPEPEYDQFVRLGARLFQAPMCVVSLVGEHEQWFKARHGVDVWSTPRNISFCARTLASDTPVIVLNALDDPDLRDNPLVTGDPKIRFYAGAPLIDAAGVHLGAFSISDIQPRDRFSDDEAHLLSELADMVMSRISKRQAARTGRAAAGFAGASTFAVVTADAKGRISFWNAAAETLFGYSACEVIGRSLDIIIPQRFQREHRAGLARVANGGAARLAGKTVEVVARRRDGTEFPIEMAVTGWEGPAGREFGAQIQDISVRRQREMRLQHLAEHDPLTGLMNRAAFRDQLAARLSKGEVATLLALDFDGFKSVNDNFGHAVGDALLQAIAIRLRSVTEQTDVLGRLGGDEFALAMNEADLGVARQVADRLLQAFQHPFQIAGHTLQVGLSVGAAMAPLHASEVDELLVRADVALLASKKRGGRQVRFFDAGLSDRLAAGRAFKDELREAVEQEQWELFYQPQVRLADGALIGVEALLRWRHPVRGLLTPDTFLPILETHGVAYEVGRWILDESCRQLAAWRRAGWPVPRVSINLFAAQFTSGTLELLVAAALLRHGLRHHDLELEVTERIALRPDDQIPVTLEALREAGVHIALDDFGTGFASLTTIKQLPVTRLKIDKSFVEDVCNEPHSAAIVAAIISLAERLGLEIVAEGIETEAQRATLIRLGCESGQGYLFGRPAAACHLSAVSMMAA